MSDEVPVRLSSSRGRVLFKAPRFTAAWIGYRREGFFEYAGDLKLIPVQQPGTLARDDHWVASRPMSEAEKAACLREVDHDNRAVEGELRRGAGPDS